MSNRESITTTLYHKNYLRIDEEREPGCAVTLLIIDEIAEQTIEIAFPEVAEISAVLKKFQRKYQAKKG